MPNVTEATIEAESGFDYSYTLDYDFGILETVVLQSFTMTGSGDMVINPTQEHLQSFTMGGSGDLVVSPTITQSDSFTMTGSGDLVLDTKFVAGVPASGWHVVIIHPVTRRRLVPQVLDRDPAILPSLGTQPEVRIPVRKNDNWLNDDLDDDPDMLVWKDGVRQPIDELREVEDRPDHTLLIGVGATELEKRVQVEHRSERRHVAAQDLVTGDTSYSEDVDTPTVETLTDEDQLDSSTTGGFDSDTDFADDEPLTTAGDEINTLQTAWPTEAENADTINDNGFQDGAQWSGNSPGGGRAREFLNDGDFIEFDFNVDHVIPASDFAIAVHFSSQDADTPDVEHRIDGETLNTYSPSSGGVTSTTHTNISDRAGWSAPSTDLRPADNPHTYRAEAVSSDVDVWFLDLVTPLDMGDRFGGFSYTLDDTTTQGGDGGWYLDGPELHPDAKDVVSVDSESAFSITDGEATITMDDTTGNQRLQVSNDRGDNWLPDDGTEDNTTSVDETFANTGSAIRLRVTLDRHSPSGARDTTPRFGYESQSIQSWDLDADIDLELLLTDYKEDQSILDHLNQYTTRDSLWSANLDANGDYQISWTQPGARTTSDDPDLGDFSFTKSIKSYDEVTIYGSNKEVAGATFQASNTFEDTSPAYDDIVTGSETVYDDDGTNYERNADYQIDYSDGEITIESGGDLTQGETYNIDFSVEVSGTYPPEVSNPDNQLVDTVPGVESDKAAEQIAYVIYTDFGNPRYAGTLSIPRADVGFDPLDSLTLDNLNLPSAATPLEVRGEPEISPEGLTLRLGSRSRLEEALGEIASQVRAVSRQV